MTPRYTHDVFISFKFENQIIVDKIVNLLTNKYGISCWICTEKIRAGENFRVDIAEAISAAKIVVLVQSKLSAVSKEVREEIVDAVDNGKIIMPFVIEESQLSGVLQSLLRDIHYIDATKPTLDERIGELAKDICRTLGKPFIENGANDDSVPQLQSKYSACSKYFFGRDDLLKNIHENFTAGNRVVFLRGMGGIGKSEIAKQYAKRHFDTYRTVVFAQYTDSLVKLIADDTVFSIDGISRQIKANKEVQTDIEYADDKLKFLRANCKQDTLIIIDNYDVEYDSYLEELERLGEYRLLITTRCNPNDSRYVVLSVTEISDDEALKDMMISSCSEECVTIKKSDPAFDDLFALTRRHTLALQLIAQYMEETSDSLKETVKLLKEHGFQQLSEANVVRQNESYNAYEVIKRLFALTTLSDSEKRFLKFLCFMPDTGIEREYFKKWCDRDTFRAQSHLLKRSIVRYDGESGRISMHPLIRDVVLSELTPNYSECSDFLESFSSELVDYIAWNYPITQKNIYFDCCKSIQNCVPNITKENFNLQFHMTNFSCFIDTFENNIKRLQGILREAEKLFGNTSAWVGKILHRLGWCYYAYGDYNQALNILEARAFPVLDHFIHEAPGEHIHCCCDIAKLYFKENDIVTANKFFQKAIDVINDESFADREIVQYRSIMVYTTQMQFASEQGDYNHALEYSLKSMDIANSLRYTELDQAALLFSLGRTYIKIADYNQAIKHIQTAIQIMEEYSGMLNASCSHGERHCMLYIDLTECYDKLNDIESAKKTITKAYKIADKIYRKGHPIRAMVEEKYDLLK